MKRITVFLLWIAALAPAWSQTCHWVFLTDKQGSTFDPYSYFDAKAIERYQQCGADLYDISNYPLNEGYVAQVNALATEEVGVSRWFNAVAVMATPEQIASIQRLPFVKEVVALEDNMQLARSGRADKAAPSVLSEQEVRRLHKQLVRMGGQYFRAKGIDGRGVRIAVFDGGFPQVNTHVAFQHLRDNHQIIKTWNFPNKKENVYGWSSHGLMTLSCIAGRQGDMDLGLATGAEFLLARTEVEAEPFKEEVWWQMAVEWADKNGAQIISSSLGYGKDRYYTKDMNGQSYVAKAGNMAARKGILVCNSAGNEGDDKSWRSIITPSDADSVLCVGGINASLRSYERTSFSSYGPSADGRQKPNVCAFAYAWTANTGSSNENYREVPGTSFSCPLVSGFAACALQARPELTAMQLFHEIEKSADLYPYCDYTYGYGVPQADYFTGDRKPVQPTFKFEEKEDGVVSIVPLQDNNGSCRIFIKNSQPDGTIIDYQKVELDAFTTDMSVDVYSGTIITANYNGYTESLDHINQAAVANPLDDNTMVIKLTDNNDTHVYMLAHNPQRRHNYLNESKSHYGIYYSLGLPVTMGDEMTVSPWSPAQRVGFRWTYSFTKAYGWGMAAECGWNSYNFKRKDAESNALERMIGMDAVVDNADKIHSRNVTLNQFSLEIYQRVRFLPGGQIHNGLHWDLGGYVSWANNIYRVEYSQNADGLAEKRDMRLNNVTPLRATRLLYGVTTRFTYDIIGIYARYNLQNLGKELAADEVALPRLEVGLQLQF